MLSHFPGVMLGAGSWGGAAGMPAGGGRLMQVWGQPLEAGFSVALTLWLCPLLPRG